MARAYRIVVADSEGGVMSAARQSGWTVLLPVRQMSELDTLDDGSLGPAIGRVFVSRPGFVALAFKD